MRTDAVEIERFYRSQRGRAARMMALRRLEALWSNTDGLDVLGFGYASPYLGRYQDKARRVVAYMPGAQGAIRWPEGSDHASLTALGTEERLPFSEGLFDRIIVVHGLEEADNARKLLREFWRVLAPEGRMVIISAHREGMWSRADSTPFGHGRPYSKGQLARLLTSNLFEPVAWAKALYTPAWSWTSRPRLAQGFEKTGEHLWPALGGLILVEAVKHVGAIRPGNATAPVRIKSLEAKPGAALSPASKRDSKPHNTQTTGTSS